MSDMLIRKETSIPWIFKWLKTLFNIVLPVEAQFKLWCLSVLYNDVQIDQ